MEIIKSAIEDGKMSVTVKGSLDTTTSPDLQAELEASLEGVTSLTLDFSALDYISSAGLRVLLVANKRLVAAGGSLTLVGLNPAVREVFDMTGFADLFTLA